MSFALRSNQTSPIAIDFGASSLKVLQITAGDSPSLIAAAQLEMPDDMLEDDAARLQYQIASLPALLKKAGFRNKRAVCSLSATQTIVQHLQIPKIEGASFGSLVAGQLQHVTPIPPSELVLRHYQVGELMRNGRRCNEILCVAIPRQAVMSIVRGLKACKLDVVGVHCEHTAIVPSFHSITRRDEDENLDSLYIDIGFGSTKVAIAHGRELVFAKTIDLGGRTLDAPIAKQTRCSLSDARRKRNEYLVGAPAAWSNGQHMEPTAPPASAPMSESGDGGSYQASAHESATAVADDRRSGQTPAGHQTLHPTETPTSNMSAPCTGELLDALVDELSMCLRHHHAIFPNASIGRTIFVGGESEHTELCRQLAQRLRLHAQVANPLSCIGNQNQSKARGLDLTKSQPGWAVPLGLCIAPTDL